jgi:hypothetical protein
MTLAKRRSMFAVLLILPVLGCSCNEPKFAQEPPPNPMPPPPPAVVATAPPAPAAGPCDPVQQLAMTTTFQTRAAAEAPRMKPEGAPVCAVLPEGQTATGQPFVLEAGYCYTFLAQSLPPVSDVYLEVQVDPPPTMGLPIPPQFAPMLQNRVIAVDTEVGDKASVYAKKDCYQWAIPMPLNGKLVVKAAKGSGPVAAQVFKRKM